MAIQDDFSITTSGDIRYTGTTANYTVIAFHRWLGDLMDDAQAAGNDLLDITDATASERSTDNIITLNSPYNIDDTAAQHLYDGSIIQTNGDVIYDGVLVFANAGAYLQIVQNGGPVAPNFWTTGINADAANGISHRFMLKVRTGASDIDGRRLVGQTREFGFTYSEFKINGTSRGNNVLALTYATDLNNATAAATVKGWTTITNQEGYRLLDVNNDTTDEPYYSEWNKDTFTINQLFERLKWLSRRSTIEDSNAETGANYAIGNATINGQGQSFANGVVAQFLTRIHARLKKVGSPTGNLVAKLYAHSGTFGTSSVATGGALATSDNLDVSKLTTAYQELEIGFSTQFEMVASTNYVIAFEYTGGDASNYVHVEGDATGTHAGNKAELTGAWAAQAAEDLWFQCFASPKLYGRAGEKFRGVTHEIVIDTPTGTFGAVEAVSWPGGTGQMLAIDSTTAGTKMWIQLLTGVPPTDNQLITGSPSTATALMNVTITERTLSFPFAGASTGSALIGAYGVGVETADLSASDKLFDLTDTQRTPPNNVTFTVSGLSVLNTGNLAITVVAAAGTFTRSAGSFLTDGFYAGQTIVTSGFTNGGNNVTKIISTVSATVITVTSITGLVDETGNGDEVVKGLEDRVLVGPESGGVLQLAQLALNTTLSGAGETAVVTTAAIPTDTPSSGTIRIELDSGIYRRVAYTSFTGSTFTIAATDFTTDNATAANNLFISYIDKVAEATSETFTVVYNANRALFVRVRDGGDTPIKTFETTGTLGSAGGSATAIRTSDA